MLTGPFGADMDFQVADLHADEATASSSPDTGDGPITSAIIQRLAGPPLPDGEGESVPPDQIGVFGRRAGATQKLRWYLDANGNFQWDGNLHGDRVCAFGGVDGDLSVAGDFDGDDIDEIGVYRPGNQKFYVDANGNYTWDKPVNQVWVDHVWLFQTPGEYPVTGDFDGDGKDQIGMFVDGNFYLDTNANGIWDAGVDSETYFGAGTPVCGDMDGNGRDEIGVYRGGLYYFDTNNNGTWDRIIGGDTVFNFGSIDDTPVIGDFNGDGKDEVGVKRDKRFYLDLNEDGRWSGLDGGDAVYRYVDSDTLPVTGKWAPPNEPPVATHDHYEVLQDDTVSGNVVTDDTGNGPDYDPDHSGMPEVTFQSINQSSTIGIVTDLGNGNFEYDPDGQFDFLGQGLSVSDLFTYSINDFLGDSGTGLVLLTVTGTNDEPMAMDDPDETTDEATPIIINVLANDTDIDTADIPNLDLNTFDTTSQRGATISLHTDGKSLSYDPREADLLDALAVGGSIFDTFTYSIIDPHGVVSNSATVTVEVAGANDNPVANPDSGTGYETDEDTAFDTGNVLTNDTDPDTVPTPDLLAVSGVDAVSAAGAEITDNLDGTFDYDPFSRFENLPAGGSTTDTFNYTVDDGNGGTDSGKVTITINGVNDAPFLAPTNPSGGDTDEDTPVDIDLDGLASITDVDDAADIGGIAIIGVTGNGTLRYTLTGGGPYVDIESPSPSQAVLLPDSADLEYTPDGLNGETVEIIFRAWDQTTGNPGDVVDATSVGGSTAFSHATDTIKLNVTDVNDPPTVLNPMGSLLLDDGDPQPAPIGLLATDPGGSGVFFDVDNGDTLTFTIQGNTNPGLVQVDPAALASGVLQLDYADYAPEQDRTPAQITILATDSGGLFAEDTIDATVTPINTVNVEIVVRPAATTSDEFDFFVAQPSASTPGALGQGRFHLYGPQLDYSIAGLEGFDLPGETDPTPDPTDDITRISFHDASQGGALAFTIYDKNTPANNDDDLEIDAPNDTVMGTWEDGAEGLQDYLNQLYDGDLLVEVTVNNFESYVLANRNITPQAEVDTLPQSETSFVEGETYFVEMWVQDSYALSTGLASVYVELHWDPTLSMGPVFDNNLMPPGYPPGTVIVGDPFDQSVVGDGPGDIDNDSGTFRLGGETLSSSVATAPAWARVGAIEFTAIDAGAQDFELDLVTIGRNEGPDIDASQISLGTATVDQQGSNPLR